MTVILPRAGAPLVEGAGPPTREHYRWCQIVTEAVNSGTLSGEGAAAAIAAIATALGSPDGTVANIPPQNAEAAGFISGGTGVSVFGTLAAGNVQIGLASLDDDGAGTLQGITRDDYGRVSGTLPVTAGSNITITDIGASIEIAATDPLGAFATYLTDEAGNHLTDPDGNLLASGVVVPVDMGGTGADTAAGARASLGVEATIASGTSAQFYRGDKTWSNEFLGDLTFRSPSINNSYKKVAITASVGNESLMGLNGYGANGVSNEVLGGTLNFRAYLPWTIGDNGCDFAVRLITHGTTTLSERFRVRGNGDIQAGADNTQGLGSALVRYANAYATNLRPGAGGVIWTSGAGTPDGVVVAPVGSLFTRTDGGAGTTLYVKESGAGNTGWTAK